MEIPNLPTDNLYKFMALSGLTLFMFMIYIGQKNYFEIQTEIDKIKIELLTLKTDTMLFSIRNEDMYEKKIILNDFFAEKYPESYKSFNNSTDSMLIYNFIYSLSLRNPDLLPLYKKYEEYTKEYINLQLQVVRNTFDKQIQYIHLNTKKKSLLNSFLFYGLIALLGIVISIIGFAKWYNKIQIYQDKALNGTKSVNKKKKVASPD